MHLLPEKEEGEDDDDDDAIIMLSLSLLSSLSSLFTAEKEVESTRERIGQFFFIFF